MRSGTSGSRPTGTCRSRLRHGHAKVLVVEDIVAVEVTTDSGQRCYFLTWGRIQDNVDPEPLEAVIMSVASRFATPGVPVRARLCTTLQEARDAPDFFESFFSFCQRPIPFGDGYEEWRTQMDERMRAGHEIAAIGPFPLPAS